MLPQLDEAFLARHSMIAFGAPNAAVLDVTSERLAIFSNDDLLFLVSHFSLLPLHHQQR